MKKLSDIALYAWMGKDELGSGEIGIKGAVVPAGYIPIVAVNESKVNRDEIANQLNIMGKQYGTRISLCRFKFDEVIREVGSDENS